MRLLFCLLLVWSTLLSGAKAQTPNKSQGAAVAPPETTGTSPDFEIRPGDSIVVKIANAPLVVGSSIVGCVTCGQKLEVQSVQADWCWVKSLKCEGWINRRYVDKVSVSNSRVSSEGDMSRWMNRADLQRSVAVAAIKKLGGQVTFDEKNPGKPVIGVDLSETEVTDAGLVHLNGLTNLQTLGLSNTEVTGDGLIHLKEVTGLQELYLYGTQVTDAGLEHLKGLTSLQGLNLGDTTVTDVGLVHLKGLTSLQGLNLAGTKVSDVGLEHLKRLTSLQLLNLSNTKVTDAGLVHLKGLTSLHTLYLNGTKVTDVGLEHLKGLTSLQLLNLGDTQVTDAGLVHLKGLTSLHTLYLYRTKVTDVGLEHLKRLTSLQFLNLGGSQVANAELDGLKGLTSLQTLNLAGTKVTDAGLVHLKGLTRLRTLNLAYTQVADAGMVHLKGMTSLESLDLLQTKVADAGLEHFKGLTSLQNLWLDGTEVTDAGLVHLKGMTSLSMLSLSGSKVSEAGVKDLEAALPKCRIGPGDSVAQSNGDPTSKQNSNVEDSFDGKSLAPLWKSYSHDGLTVEESDGIAKIYGIVPSFPERYVRAGFELTDSIPVESFEASIDVVAVSGTFGGAKHRQRSFAFTARGSNGQYVAVRYWANQYSIAVNNGSPREKRLYAPSIGDEMSKQHKWRIVYDSTTKSAKVFIDDLQIRDAVKVDLDDSFTLKVSVACMPDTPIEGHFDNFRLNFSTDSHQTPGDTFLTQPSDAGPKNPSEDNSRFALDFNGSSSHVVVPLKPDWTLPFTVEAWVCPSILTGHREFLCDAQTAGVAFGFYDGVCSFLLHDGRKYRSVRALKTAVPAKEIHLAGVFDGDRLNLFVDGKRQGAGTAFTGRAKLSRLPLHIGANPETGNRVIKVFSGTIDEVRVSKVARYQSDFTPSRRFKTDTETLALYHFDESNSRNAVDSSGNARHGQIRSASRVPELSQTPFTDESQAAAVAAIKKLGGRVTFDEKKPGKPVVGVSLSGQDVTDASLVHLKGLASLKYLVLMNTQVTDAGVEDLQSALPRCKISK
jgi:Leucine-rich repeat (LRR) protein